MRIGLVVDGQAELYALPHLTKRLGIQHTILAPLKADIQPISTPLQIARAVKTPIKILFHARRVDRVVILLDHETRTECPGVWCSTLTEAVRGHCEQEAVTVVVKNRTFENWLIADLDAIRALVGRFTVSKAVARSISGNADSANGIRVLKECAHDTPYQKVGDSIKILSRARPDEIARQSRSFRKFLRALGHPSYKGQSASPARRVG